MSHAGRQRPPFCISLGRANPQVFRAEKVSWVRARRHIGYRARAASGFGADSKCSAEAEDGSSDELVRQLADGAVGTRSNAPPKRRELHEDVREQDGEDGEVPSTPDREREGM